MINFYSVTVETNSCTESFVNCTVFIFKNVNQGHFDRGDKEKESKSLPNSIFHLDYVISSLLLIYVISLSKHHNVW